MNQDPTQTPTPTPIQTPYIVVHFTTIPPRFPYLQYTIQSWLNQSIPVDKIVISIRENYKHFGVLQSPERVGINSYKKLSDKISIQILDGKDHGPNDKIIGALTFCKKMKENKNNLYIIICDDDLAYHVDTVKSYFSPTPIQTSTPTIYTHFATTQRLPGIFHLQGADSYMLPSYFFENTTLSEYIDFLDKSMKECPDTFYQDDYMISYYATIIRKMSIECVKQPLMYQHVHSIEELHKHPAVHEREKHTIEYLSKKV